MSEAEDAHCFRRRLLKHQQDAEGDIVLKAAFRMEPRDRSGNMPHGISCYHCPEGIEGPKAAHLAAKPTTTSGSPLGLASFKPEAIALANSENSRDEEITLILQKGEEGDPDADLHCLVTCPATDVEVPVKDQGFPTSNQAITLANNSKLEIKVLE